ENRHRHQGAVAVNQNRGYTSALRWFRVTPPSHGTPDAPPAPSASGLSSAARERRDAARELATQPRSIEHAVSAYREAAALAALDEAVVLEYARFLIKNSLGTAAEEVLGLSLARNGAQIDALELYLELLRELDFPAGRASWAMRRLEADIAMAPEEHR